MCGICHLPHALCRWPDVHDRVDDHPSPFRAAQALMFSGKQLTENTATGGTMLLGLNLPPRPPRAHEVDNNSRFWMAQTDGRDHDAMIACVQNHIREAVLDLTSLCRESYPFQLRDVETPYLSTDDMLIEHLAFTASVDMALLVAVPNALIVRISYAIIGPDMRAVFRYMDLTNRVTYYDHYLRRCAAFCSRDRHHDGSKMMRTFDATNLLRCEREPLSLPDRYGLVVMGLHASNLCAVVFDRYLQTIDRNVELTQDLMDAIVRANSSNTSYIDWLPCQARRRGGVVILRSHETLRTFRNFLQSTRESTLLFVEFARQVETYRHMPHVTVRTKGDWTNLPTVKRVVFECVPPSYTIGHDDSSAMTALMQTVEIVWVLTTSAHDLQKTYSVFDFPEAMDIMPKYADTLYSHNLFCL